MRLSGAGIAKGLLLTGNFYLGSFKTNDPPLHDNLERCPFRTLERETAAFEWRTR